MNLFSENWEAKQSSGEFPTRVRAIESVSFRTFAEEVATGDAWFRRVVVDSLFAGDVWILKRAFSSAFMDWIRIQTAGWMRDRPPSFHKMLEGTPDFHRIIDLETGKNYSFKGCKHSAYFYRWNDDPIRIWGPITEQWRVAKTVMGLDPKAYESFTPRDGVVDRIQVVRYPPAIGYLEPHADPHLHQRCFFGGYMSKRGRDYEGGGFYLVGKNDRPVEIEDMLEVGDVTLGCATIVHGVAPCDRGKAQDWGAIDGRWFLSMYSNASDEVPQRHTGRPVNLNFPEMLP